MMLCTWLISGIFPIGSCTDITQAVPRIQVAVIKGETEDNEMVADMRKQLKDEYNKSNILPTA